MSEITKIPQFEENIDTFTIKFGGKKHTINAELFTNAINNTVELVKLSANAINPDIFLRLEIQANKEGSFITTIDTIIKHVRDLLSPSTISYASNIIQGYVSFLYIKEHLKGKKPLNIETKKDITAIENQEHQIFKVPSNIANKYFENAQVENCIIKIFDGLEENATESYTIEHEDKKILFNQDQYNMMSEKIIDGSLTGTIEKQNPIEVNLLLKKPDLLGDSAWQFVYNKNISAKINDKEFLDKVHRRRIKTLYAGVKIPCLLQIEYELDEILNPVPNSDKYTILKVTGDIIEPKEISNNSLFSN